MVGAGLAGEPHASHQLARTAGVLAGNDFPIRVVAIFRNACHVFRQAVNQLLVAYVLPSLVPQRPVLAWDFTAEEMQASKV